VSWSEKVVLAIAAAVIPEKTRRRTFSGSLRMVYRNRLKFEAASHILPQALGSARDETNYG